MVRAGIGLEGRRPETEGSGLCPPDTSRAAVSRQLAENRWARAASCSIDSTVDFGSLGPIGHEPRFFHLATVFGLMP